MNFRVAFQLVNHWKDAVAEVELTKNLQYSNAYNKFNLMKKKQIIK